MFIGSLVPRLVRCASQRHSNTTGGAGKVFNGEDSSQALLSLKEGCWGQSERGIVHKRQRNSSHKELVAKRVPLFFKISRRNYCANIDDSEIFDLFCSYCASIASLPVTPFTPDPSTLP